MLNFNLQYESIISTQSIEKDLFEVAKDNEKKERAKIASQCSNKADNICLSEIRI